MEYSEALELCKKHGQEQMLAYYNELDEAGRQNLLRQIETLDFTLFEALKKEHKDQEKGIISPIEVMETAEIAKRQDEFFEAGCSCIRQGKAGAVLLAGGQGTRLGFDKPKGMLNVGIGREYYLFEILISNLMDVVRQTDTYVPLYIMTSEKNHEDTVRFFEDMEYFGYPKRDVFFFMQEMAPSVGFDGKVLMEDRDRISLSPNGNGGWFSSMAKSGALGDAKERGVEWLNVFSVDNVLQRIADPVFIGATLASGMAGGSKVIRKASPEERVGVMCLEDGRPSIVEYYELSDEMRYAVNDAGTLEYGFGVILNYLFQIQDLERIMNHKIPVHVVEKKIPYMNEGKEQVKPEEPNGYKFETLILDFIHLLDSCLPFEVVREKEFAPIKNRTGVDSLESARELLRLNGVEC